MPNNSPRVSIGLPVYNGSNYLREAVDAVIAQTFQDWELVISDNCSTDETEAICRRYAAADPRIRYHRNTKNLGATPNHNRTIDLSRGEYFKLYAHDDVILPTFLERCVEVLDREPGVVMVHTRTMIMDAHGKQIGPDPWRLRTSSPDPRVRFHDLVWLPHHCFQIYSVMRLSELRQTPLLGIYLASDQMLLAEMGLRGRFHEIDEFLFLSRRHDQQSIATIPVYMRGQRRKLFGRLAQLPRLGWADTSKERQISFKLWRLIGEYFRAVARSPVSWGVKLWCWSSLSAYSVANLHRLGRDLLVALDQWIQQTAWAERVAARRADALKRAAHWSGDSDTVGRAPALAGKATAGVEGRDRQPDGS
jgi:glycosyltransferase involved in cell wall biosynthesis